MIQELLRSVQKSFSAKIIALVICSVMVTSFVVGLATTHSTSGFLAGKMNEKFPSVLASAQSRVRSWYLAQFRDLERLSASTVFHEDLVRYLSADIDAEVRARSQSEMKRYLDYVHEEFGVYDELTVFDAERNVITTTSADLLYRDVIEQYLADGVESPRFTPAHVIEHATVVHQWLLVPILDDRTVLAWMVARINIVDLSVLLRESTPAVGGEVYLLDRLGRFLTLPRDANIDWVGQRAMQVPTRQRGMAVVEIRENFGGRRVFHSKVHLEEQGWWLVYEEDYKQAMAPVLNVQRRLWLAVLMICAIAILLALRIAKSILRPIHDLAVGARRINEGLVGVHIPRGSDDEIGSMIEMFNEMAKRIALTQAELQYKNKRLNQQNDELETMNEKLETLSVTDGLTGLFNHRHFWNLLNTELTRVDLYKGDLALVLVDLDDFKRVNDQFGHAVGDLLLQSVSRVLRENVRATDIVARYGGEEFAILMPDTSLKERGADDVVEKVRLAVESLRFKVPETDIALRITVSIGVSVFSGNRREFFNAADRALYQSKESGKNQIHYSLS